MHDFLEEVRLSKILVRNPRVFTLGSQGQILMLQYRELHLHSLKHFTLIKEFDFLLNPRFQTRADKEQIRGKF